MIAIVHSISSQSVHALALNAGSMDNDAGRYCMVVPTHTSHSNFPFLVLFVHVFIFFIVCLRLLMISICVFFYVLSYQCDKLLIVYLCLLN